MSDRLTVILPPAASAEELAVAEFGLCSGSLFYGDGWGAGSDYNGHGSGASHGYGNDFGDGLGDGYGWASGDGGSEG
jgi:hypothetical protein